MIHGAVVDASAALSWILPGEQTGPSLALRDRAVAEPAFALLVPPTFWYEVGNVLWVATRRSRIDRAVALDALEALQAFAFETWEVEPRSCLEMALGEGLSVYDAAYLQLATVAGGALWTLDRSLAYAAHAKGLRVEPAVT
ncbi:type II toxin-antitoxin system VapC family toxin [Geochorda subterranea]|uniref:Ribonuclease VapC n=1 Tax=Geochorda subterranea TaxID=3109564 RepID=A0ABZ1BLE2_9FIRM|nr:type II toxin-antitoxin system VapC family toxin [Limnochorda sp. LNt]WRP13645.1 type II toxin-antitoxin system VapC family toxin [Limnochorda sp. LNt]